MTLITSTVTDRNQTTLPKQVVKALHLKADTKLRYELMDDGTVLLTAKTETFASVAAKLAKRRHRKIASLEELKKGARRGAAKAFLESLR